MAFYLIVRDSSSYTLGFSFPILIVENGKHMMHT